MLQTLDVRVNPPRKIEMPWNKDHATYFILFLPCLKFHLGKSTAEGKKGTLYGLLFPATRLW